MSAHLKHWSGRYMLEQLITAVTPAVCYSEIKWTDGEWLMKRSWKLVTVLSLLVFGTVASNSAMAQRGGRGGGYGDGRGYSHGNGHGGGVGLGLALGAAIVGLAYYSRPAYSYPAYTYPEPAYPYTYPGPAYAYPGPAVAPSAGYIEQYVPHAAPAPAQVQGDWFYCAGSNAYYPYVRECLEGWQRVPSTPPR